MAQDVRILRRQNFKTSEFWPKSDDSAHRILRSKNSIGLQPRKNVTEQSLVLQQQQYEVHTDVRVAIDALEKEYNHDARTQSPRLSAARSVEAGSDLETKRNSAPSSPFVTYVSYDSTHIHSSSKQQQQQQVIVLGSDAWLKKCHVKRLGTSLPG